MGVGGPCIQFGHTMPVAWAAGAPVKGQGSRRGGKGWRSGAGGPLALNNSWRGGTSVMPAMHLSSG